MKKRLLALLVITMLSLTACTKVASVNDNKQKETSMFIQVEQTATWRVVYHKDTKVMYAISLGNYNCGTFTLLVNPDGTPMLYEEED